MTERTVLTEHTVHEAEERRREEENLKIALLFSLLLLLIFPFVFLLPLLFLGMWPKDYRRIPPRRRKAKERVWIFVFLLTSFSFTSFFLLPYARAYVGNFMFWSFFYPLSSPTTDIILNSILFAITGIALPVAIAIPLRSYLVEKYGDNQLDEYSMLLPTKSGTIVLDHINTGIMVLGAPRGGKTELIKTFIYHLIRHGGSRKDYVWIIFDPKGDYYKEFGKKGDIYLSVHGSNYGWNIFREIDPKKVSTDTLELAKEIFQARKTGEDKFWMTTAQQLFSAFLTVMYREAIKEGKIPTNEDFRDFINALDIKKAYELLNEHEDLKSVAEYINPKASKQASGVWSNFYSHLNEIFIGDFYKTWGKPQMSIREYVANPRGRKLFIEYDVESGAVVSPIFRLLIDRAIKYSFSPKNHYGKDGKPRKKFFIIDEFQLIPPIKKYQELVNFGRSYFITSVIGIQSIAQVIEKYNRDLTNAIVAGHAYLFAFRVYDKESTELIRDRIGKAMAWQREATSKVVKGHSVYAGDRYSVTEYVPVSESKIRTLPTGTCIIVTPEGFKEVKLYLFKEAKRIIDEELRKMKSRRRR